ncbi:hypothetical protein V1477_019774 [Vespula maculifrons]|uniref:Uncharacterized protein n=1 Tax=Vespula maculifrons TaxID=7453 RepID=A0ABD2ARE0_VESMC
MLDQNILELQTVWCKIYGTCRAYIAEITKLPFGIIMGIIVINTILGPLKLFLLHNLVCQVNSGCIKINLLFDNYYNYLMKCSNQYYMYCYSTETAVRASIKQILINSYKMFISVNINTLIISRLYNRGKTKFINIFYEPNTLLVKIPYYRFYKSLTQWRQLGQYGNNIYGYCNIINMLYMQFSQHDIWMTMHFMRALYAMFDYMYMHCQYINLSLYLEMLIYVNTYTYTINVPTALHIILLETKNIIKYCKLYCRPIFKTYLNFCSEQRYEKSKSILILVKSLIRKTVYIMANIKLVSDLLDCSCNNSIVPFDS